MSNENLFKFASRVFSDKGHYMTESELRGFGLDLPIAETMFEEEIRPRLKNLHGYRSLGDLSDLKGQDVLGSVRNMVSIYSDIRVVPVLKRTRSHPKNGPISVIKVWLARDGRWFVWTADYTSAAQRHRGDIYADGPNETEKIHIVDTLAEVCGLIEELMGSDSGLGSTTRSAEYAKYAPLIMEQKLRDLLGRTIAGQEKNLAATKKALDSATKRTSMIRYY